MESRTSAGSRTVLVVVVVLVVAAIAGAAVLSALRSTPDLDPSTPEGVAQAYFSAILDGDERAALSLLTPDLQERCDDRDFRPFFVEDSVRVVLTSTEVTAGEAEVTVEIDRVSDPSPFNDGYSTHEILTMTTMAGGWVISEVPWPFFCPEGS
jgi:hypothetical protein